MPALFYLSIAVYWHLLGIDYLTGDESYYLFVTESMIEDHDLDVRNNLERYGLTAAEMAKELQIVERPYGWFSVHNLGLSVLMAVPWSVAGPWGARVALALYCGLVAPVLFQAINRIWRSPANALLMTMAVALGLPLLHASNQIYPDLLVGILLLYLAQACWFEDPGEAAGQPATWLFPIVLAILPWFHIKYTAPALLLAAWHIDATRRRRALACGASLALSLLLLASYNAYAFGKLTGPYSPGNGLALCLNSFIVFVGLHFDQAQGMFLQQPLWLLGVFGLASMWRSARRASLWWVLLYASVIVPNAMHPNWYGGYSFVGRFGSTNVLLWTIPLAYGARLIFRQANVAPAIVVLVSLAFQGWLACHWLRSDGLLLGCVLPESVWAYNSIYPSMLKVWLPYWPPDVKFWNYPANLAAAIVIGALLLCGASWQQRRRLALLSLPGGLAAAAMLIAVLPPSTPGAEWAADTMRGDVGRQERGWRTAAAGRDARGLLLRTPDLFTAPGDYRVRVNYRAGGRGDPVGGDWVGIVMFRQGDECTALSLLKPADEQACEDSSTLHVAPGNGRRRSSFFVWFEGRGTLSVGRLAVERINP